MSLQFYFGSSGAGKSKKLHMDIIQWAQNEPDTNFLILVPDQFTMQTQMDLVKDHPRQGILNIDVLSFGRLSHRIWEEVGGESKQILDDTGKSLILRKIAADEKDKLPYIGSNLKKLGYIHEVKSSISEFMQYGIEGDQLDELLMETQGRQVLNAKLKDLSTLYQGFLSYIKGRYITTEETLDRLREQIKHSNMIKNSVVVLDGFTGFTPVQYRLLQELMRLTKRMMMTITTGEETSPFQIEGEEELFYLSKKTVHDLCKLAEEMQVEREVDIYVVPERNPRFLTNPEMAHLERYLFRHPISTYEQEPQLIRLMEASDIGEEVRRVFIEIRRLTTKQKYCYRDIAIIMGDSGSYARYVEREAKRYAVPVYLDRTRGIQLNPMIEYIRSALHIMIDGFTYEAVFHYMRSGFADFLPEEIDRLENYVLALGIKGKKRWTTMFTRQPGRGSKEAGVKQLEELNHLRLRLLDQLSPLLQKMKTVDEMILALYQFIYTADVQKKLAGYESFFKQAGDPVKEREYAQIYRLVMELLEQIYALLKQEKMTLEEFSDILDAGFLEIEVGSIPQNIDRVVAGDMERTRLKQVKVLFFLGINDGNIPKNSGTGGIISDLEREYLQAFDVELSPTPRQKIYIQRLYLYMNMTKPSDLLYLSFSDMNEEGKTLRPAYLIETMRKLFPMLTIEYPKHQSQIELIVGKEDVLELFLFRLRKYADGYCSKEERQELFSLYGAISGLYENNIEIQELLDAAFMQYEHHPLSRDIASLLYGSTIMGSASRLEQYAACAYAHFLKYGLTLRERDEYQLEQVDIGNLYHGVLELFSNRLEKSDYTWFDFPKQEGEAMLRSALDEYSAAYGETIFYSNARNEYVIERMERILLRSITTIQKQLKQGVFMPKHVEVSFQQADKLSAVNIALSENERLKLTGRIDRIDTYEDDEHVYIKVIDYKSGNQKFDLAALYHGLQLQLVIYMNAALEMEQRANPDKEVVPAALLYYHINDPLVKSENELTDKELNERILQELRMNGIVNERDGVVPLLDKDFTEQSFVIPVQKKKDGDYGQRSSLMDQEELALLSAHVNRKIKQFGQEILSGEIELNPYVQSDKTACTYCTYQHICGFEEGLYGYKKRVLPPLGKEEAMDKIKEENS